MKSKHLHLPLFILVILIITVLSSCQSHEHVYGDWTIEKEASCTEEGTKTRTCSCGNTETEVIEKTCYSYGEWQVTIESTCAKEGTQTHTCTNCGKSETKPIDKKSHSYGEWQVTVEATCAKEGTQTHTCTNCGKSETKPIDKKSHSWREATCAHPKTCSVCGATEGSSLTHAFPNSEFQCTKCGQKVYASDYEYLVASSFRNIRREYSNAVATKAIMIMYNDSLGHTCVLTKIYYTIGTGKFDDEILYDFTSNNTIQDPESYYTKLKDRAYGNDKLKYLDVLINLNEMEQHILKGDEYAYTVSADYLNK